jgi:hypothetical protein
MVAPYSANPPSGEAAAKAMLARSMPAELVQAAGSINPGAAPTILRAGGPGAAGMAGGMAPGMAVSPPGVPFAPVVPGMPAGPSPVPGVVAAVGALPAGGMGGGMGGMGSRFPMQRTEVRFAGPPGMKIAWGIPGADGKLGFTGTQLEAPARYNFVQGALYRLKLSNIPNWPGLELYPTLEVVPSNAKTDPFLAHSAVPIAFTEEDFFQVSNGNFLVKVIYLPDPQFQDLATVGPDEIVSSRLAPGVDPIAEAYRRGNILLVIRLGNIDLEAPNTPSMDTPGQYMPAKPGHHGHGMMPGMPGAAMMAGMGPGRPPLPGGGMMMMTPNGPVLMTPSGPMLMTPNGPVPMPPPGGPPPSTPPATGGSVPALPTSGQPATPPPGQAAPVSQLPKEVPVTQTGHGVTTTAKETPESTVIYMEQSAGSTRTVQPSKRRWLFGK